MSNAPSVTAATGTQQTWPTTDNNTKGVSTLLYSCQQGDVNKVRRILRAQPDGILERDRTGKTALHYCCTSDHISAAQAADILVMAAPDLVDSRDEEGFTPLHLAVIAGNMPLVTFLLANHADINAVDNEKHTVVHWATVCGETVALRALLAVGAPVSTPDVHGGYPLHYAAQMCGGEKDQSLGLQVLHTLLSNEEIDVSVEDEDGRPPLLWAASAGSAKAVLALIRAGSSVEAHDKDGLTALHCAASRGHTDCIDSLLTLCGASPDVIDSNGCTALHYAVTLGHADATALLLSHSADPNRQDRKGRSPAHCGCAKGQFETVKMLSSNGANLWLRNARGDLPLHEAAASGRRDLVRWLLEARPSQVNARNNDGRCPLHLAALNDNADMCKILIDAGAHINPVLRTSKNVFMTPIDCALQRGFRSTAKYLQLHGCVPANRLTGISHGPGVSSAISLHIRDDVTLWGGTSSEGESEELEQKKVKKKIYKRKLDYKYDKKREPVSLSDLEPTKLASAKLDVPVADVNVKDDVIPEESVGFVNSAHTHQGEIIIYANEVNINDQMRDIRIQRNNGTSDLSVLKHQPENAVESNKKSSGSSDKRPKSAKYGRLKNKPKKSNETEQSHIDSDSSSKHVQVGTSDNNVTQHIDEISSSKPKTELGNSKLENDSKSEQAKKMEMQSDQQSARSNTSYDEEEDHKEIVVEVSVHSPPKDVQSGKETDTDVQKLKDDLNIMINASKTKKLKNLTTTDTVQNETENIVTTSPNENITDADENNDNKLESKTTEVITNTDTMTDTNNVEAELKLKGKEETLSKEKENNVAHNDTKTPEINHDNTKQSVDENCNEANKTVTGLPINSKEHILDEGNNTSETINVSNPIGITIKSKEKTNSQSPINDDDTEVKLNKNGQDIPANLESEKIKSKSSSKNNINGTKMTPNQIIKTPRFEQQKRDSVKNSRHNHLEDQSSEEEISSSPSSLVNVTAKKHQSFKVLKDNDCEDVLPTEKSKKPHSQHNLEERSQSRVGTSHKQHERLRRSKIPTPILNLKTPLSKSDRYLERYNQDHAVFDVRVPSLPNIYYAKDSSYKGVRSISNLSAPMISTYSDNDRETGSDGEDISSAAKRKKLKKRSRTRSTKSACSDYESSNLIDSGFEPSPRSTRLPKSKNMTERSVNMTSVTQTIQSNIRRYHLERKIFQHLLDLKRLQIRSGQHNEAVLVKRAIDAYHRSCAATVGAGRYLSQDYTFKNFENFLYNSLRKIQKNGSEHLQGLPETPRNPLHCTQSTHRCDHATHAYTGVPCAAYLPKTNHHNIPKIGFDYKPSNFLPKISAKNAVTLELCHGNDKQVISLPAERLDQNKRYYVTFTVKGTEEEMNTQLNSANHLHSKSD